MDFELRLTDALEGLKSLQDKSVDLIVTDPPYDTLEKWRNMGTTTRLKNSSQSSNEWFPTVSPDYLKECFAECYRVLSPNSHLYVMCDEETGDHLKPALREIGFSLRKSIIWHKVGKLKDQHCPHCDKVVGQQHTPGTPGMGYPYRSQWEMILLAEKGKRKPPKDKSIRNVLSFPWIKSKSAYPTQKPHELLEVFINQSSEEGDLVLDPFSGSSSTGYAAFRTRRKFLGFDVSEKAIAFSDDWRKTWEGAPHSDDPETDANILDFF